MYHLLPPEIIRKVFVDAAVRDPAFACSLSLVCKQSHQWLTPVLYEDVYLVNQTTLILFLASITSRLDLAPLVRSLWVGSVSSERVPPSKGWPRESFQAILGRILEACEGLQRLALINLPAFSTHAWEIIERSLPPTLHTLAAGPDHAVLRDPNAYPSLRRFCCIETLLEHSESSLLRSLPNLRQFHWCFLSNRMDHGVIDSLRDLLESESLEKLGLLMFGPDDDSRYGDVMQDLEKIESDRRVKKIHVFHAPDWCSAFRHHWQLSVL